MTAKPDKKYPKKTLFLKVWKKCSEYIRRVEKGRCFTCGDKRDWKQQHAGHFRHGKNKPTYFIRDNIHCQCVRCNKWLSGNLGIYGVKLVKEIGYKKVNKLIKESQQFKCWKIKELQKWDAYYTKKLKQLNADNYK